MPLKLFKYQREGVRAIIENFNWRAILADEMGLGKTVQALACLLKEPEARPAVVVCPASLKENWEREAMVHAGIQATVLHGMTPLPFRAGMVRPRLIIVNYNILQAWLPWLEGMGCEILIGDEAHYLKTPESGRTKAFARLACMADKLLFLTGTPMTNRPIELWPLLNMLNSKKFPSYRHFGFRYCEAKRTIWGWDFKGACRLPELHRLLKKTCMVRRLKKDVLKDLPAKRQAVVTLPLSSHAEYQAAERDTTAWIRKVAAAGRDGHLPSHHRAEAVTRLGDLKRLAAELKLPAVIEWSQNFLEETGEKLIMFCIHKKVDRVRQEAFSQAAFVTGEVTGRHRQMEFDRFNKSKSCNVFIGNIQAAGVGWSAKQCSNVAFTELSWVPGDHIQGGDRVHGLNRGQEGVKSVNWWLLAAGTIEERLAKTLQDKSRNIDMAMDGKAGRQLDVLDWLVASMKEGK